MLKVNMMLKKVKKLALLHNQAKIKNDDIFV